MSTNIYLVYGTHDIKYLKNCIQLFKKVVKTNKLSYSNIIAIIENSIIDENFPIKQSETEEEYAKRKTNLEQKDFSIFPEKKPFFNRMLDWFKKEDTATKNDFHFQLMKFLKNKGVTIVLEENNPEVIRKEIEYESIPIGERFNRILRSNHEVDNLRDKFMVTQIKKLSEQNQGKNLIIVRGALHGLLSKYLQDEGFNVKEYNYNK